MNNIFERALNLEKPWYIKEVKFNEKEKQLDIYIDFEKGATFSDESEGIITQHKAYDTANKSWRHLNFFEHECYLHARVPRIKTRDKKTKLVKSPWERLGNGFTLLFEALLLQLCSAMPVQRVEKIVNVSDDKIWRILDRYTTEALKTNDYSLVDAIGIDETSRRKGHNYITLFVDLQERKTIFITEGVRPVSK